MSKKIFPIFGMLATVIVLCCTSYFWMLPFVIFFENLYWSLWMSLIFLTLYIISLLATRKYPKLINWPLIVSSLAWIIFVKWEIEMQGVMPRLDRSITMPTVIGITLFGIVYWAIYPLTKMENAIDGEQEK